MRNLRYKWKRKPKEGLNFNEVQEVFHSEDTPTGMQPGDPTVLAFPGRPWLLYFGQGPEPPEAWGIWIAELTDVLLPQK